MAKLSYRVVCDVASTTEISRATIPDETELIILGAQSADNALTESPSIRKLWPDSKIILLHDYASATDLQKLLRSQIDGCVPLSASQDTLIGTLDLILINDVRVMVM